MTDSATTKKTDNIFNHPTSLLEASDMPSSCLLEPSNEAACSLFLFYFFRVNNQFKVPDTQVSAELICANSYCATDLHIVNFIAEKPSLNDLSRNVINAVVTPTPTIVATTPVGDGALPSRHVSMQQSPSVVAQQQQPATNNAAFQRQTRHRQTFHGTVAVPVLTFVRNEYCCDPSGRAINRNYAAGPGDVTPRSVGGQDSQIPQLSSVHQRGSFLSKITKFTRRACDLSHCLVFRAGDLNSGS
uniref:Uncharacterized protein n=1 Tax=Romanomermis culicivorax TaxID=13658 RepID=A0A915JNF3_ROMCU